MSSVAVAVTGVAVAGGVLGSHVGEGSSTGMHGKRHWFSYDAKLEGKAVMHVGLGAKVETYDLSIRAVMEIRSGVDIVATGKVAQHNPTRTFRSALDVTGIPVGTSTDAARILSWVR